ncbi:MAG: hypothetical protein JXR40_00115, partial [Pontiellaceae bacterium]|nr:hypothetical protein [Pontiellaceae bacterium]
EAIASSTEKEAPHSSKTVLTKDVQNKAPLESRTLVLIGVGVAGGITALSLMFKPFFGDFSGFLDCVRYTIQPNWISAFTGEFFDDFWGEFKLYIWFVAGILVGLACSVGVGRFWVP